MKLASFLFLLLFSTSAVFGQSTYEFLKVDMSARAAALAGSFVSNDDDPDVIFYNPAGLDLLEGNPVSISYVNHLLDINLASLSYSTNFKNVGRFGAAVKYINYGTFQGATEDGMKTGEYSVNEMAFIIGYANTLDNNFYYGANAKFIVSNISDRSSTAAAVDLGLHYSLPDEMMEFGFSILNLGSQITAYYNTIEKLPLDVTIGLSKKLAHLPLRLSLDFHRLNENRDTFFQKFKAFTVGAEFDLSKALRLRLGYDNEKRTDLKVGSFAGLAGFNVGVGLVIKGYRFDYGYSSMGQVGALHRLGLSTNL